MITAYLASTSKEQLAQFAGCFTNVVGPVQGRAALAATDEEPAQPAVGDPDKWYVSIQLPVPQHFEIPLEEGIEILSVEEGSAVLGVWA